jgi:hypothetical protein
MTIAVEIIQTTDIDFVVISSLAYAVVTECKDNCRQAYWCVYYSNLRVHSEHVTKEAALKEAIRFVKGAP